VTKSPIFGLCLGRLVCGLALLLSALLIPAAEAAEPKQVLIIHSFGRDYAPFNAVGLALRTDLAKQLRQPVAFRDVSLDIERFGVPRKEHALIGYLLSSSDEAPDMVITIGAPATRFYLRHREVLFPDRPLLVTGIDSRMLRGVELGAKDRTVTLDQEFSGVARIIRALQPNATTLALVLGASPHEQFWAEEARRELAQADSHLLVLPPEALSLEQMRQRVSGLPPNSAVFYLLFSVGADGVQYENEQALAAIREVSSAPIYGIWANQLGAGVVGGAMFDLRQMGRVTAELAASMLESGHGADSNRFVDKQSPAFDWRELERWGIPESRLPPGAEVRFRPPSLWEQHRLLILVGAAIVVLQAILITALLFQRVRRRNAEKEAAGLSGRLLTAHEDERRHLARELHDDLTQRLARLAIDAGQLERNAGADASQMRRDLVRLSEDVHALSYRLHPSVLDDLGLVEALRAECDRVASHGDVRVEVNADDVPGTVPNEASLCLFRVAQEALNNAVRHGRANAMTVLLSARGSGLQLAVSDNGSGFDPERSTDHASLGLASMRERVRLLHGQLDIESTPGRGTTVVAWVPA
jgi:signal transduction histidine kinase